MITIIVLIILAGVSISLVLRENGILTKAKEGKEEYSKTDAREKLEIDNTEIATVENGTITPTKVGNCTLTLTSHVECVAVLQLNQDR